MSKENAKVWPPFSDPLSSSGKNGDNYRDKGNSKIKSCINCTEKLLKVLPHVIIPKKNNTPSCKSILLVFTPLLSASSSYLSATVGLQWHKATCDWVTQGRSLLIEVIFSLAKFVIRPGYFNFWWLLRAHKVDDATHFARSLIKWYCTCTIWE